MMKPPRIWVLVADGSRARIVRNPAQNTRDRLPERIETAESNEDIVFEAEHKPLREIMSDKPGRSFASEGARRSAMVYHSDPVRNQEKEFASTLIATLEERRQAGEFDRLVVVAPPRMLGLIRQQLPDALRDVVTGEIAKDYTKLGWKQLRGAIAGIDLAGLFEQRQ